MIDLGGARVFLSASFPSGERGERFRPYDPEAIAEAVTAVSQAVLVARGRIVFGAHPTISPLILLIAAELERPKVVEIYQSRYFEGWVPQETIDLIERGYGVVHWTDHDPNDLDRSLYLMREEMFRREPFAAAVFVGGMEGILDENRLLGELKPEVPRLPMRAPGGAARELVASSDRVAARLAERLDSPLYPALARELVAVVADARASNTPGSV
jgi:SLOG cluster3 family